MSNDNTKLLLCATKLLLLATDLSKNTWTDCTFNELTPIQQEAVWQMVVKTYSGIGNPISGLEMLKTPDYKLCVLWTSHDDNIPQAFRFYKQTPYGNKFVISGTDGSPEAKSAAKLFTVKLLETPGWYAELSGAPASIVEKSGIRPIADKEIVEKILGKEVEWVSDGHYKRNITGVGVHEKAMYGKPNIS